MVMGLVSTFALALAFGPHLHVSLQSAVEETVTESPATEPAIIAVEASEIDDDAGDTIVPRMEVIEETPIIPDAVAEPVPAPETATTDDSETALMETENAPSTGAQNGELPAEEWPNILAQTSAALTAVETARGKFTQSNPDGSIVTGSFALNRPGRMRFDYDDPTPVLIVSDGTTVAMQDTDLDTVDRVPIGSTPLGLILATDLNVDQDVEVLSVMQNSERLGVRVKDSSGELEGTLTMVFDKTSFALLGWLAMDGNDQTTRVDLIDIESNVRIDPRLFRLNEDDDDEDER